MLEREKMKIKRIQRRVNEITTEEIEQGEEVLFFVAIALHARSASVFRWRKC